MRKHTAAEMNKFGTPSQKWAFRENWFFPGHVVKKQDNLGKIRNGWSPYRERDGWILLSCRFCSHSGDAYDS